MKRFLTLLITTLALTAALCVSASAANFHDAASELAAIGVFKGTAGGFDLDKAPTRAQAAIMLVRLYGAEEEAAAAYASGELKCPFTDVNGTAAPYVAWLVDKGLANGTSGTAFGAQEPCTSKAYTIFLLRALGYRDNEDFTSASAQEFAMSIGLLDTSLFTGPFLRDDLAALTYQALGSNLKDGSTYLLDSLIQSGAIDASAAKPITDKIETYRALQASGQALNEGTDAAADAKMTISAGLKGQEGGTSFDMSQKLDAAVTGNIQFLMGRNPQMAFDFSVTLSDGTETETQRMEYWLKDGTSYVRSGEAAYQTPADEDIAALAAMLEQSTGSSGAAMLPFIDRISAKASGGDTVYTLVLNDAFAGLITNLMGIVSDALPTDVEMQVNISMDGSTIQYTADKDGVLKSALLDMTMKADLNASEDGDTVAISVGVDMDMRMDIKHTGKAVKISYPDFSDFEKLIGGGNGPTGIMATRVY